MKSLDLEVEDLKMNTLETPRILVFIMFLEPFIQWLVLHQMLWLMIQAKNGKKWAEKHSMTLLLFQNASLLLLIQLLPLIIWFKTLDILWMVHHGSTFSYITQFISMVTWLLLMNIATFISISHNFKCFSTLITDSWVNWEPDFPWSSQITCKQSCSISGTFSEHTPNSGILTGTSWD